MYVWLSRSAGFGRWLVPVLLTGACLCGLSAQELEVTLTRTTDGGGVYTPGQALTVTVSLAASGTGTLTALGVEETLPDGWTFSELADGSGQAPDVAPDAGATGLLEFAWFSSSSPTLPDFPVEFSYRAVPPHGTEGTQTISGLALYRYLELSGEHRSANVETALTLTAEPQTYYVASNKQDGGDAKLGSMDNPFPTIGHAVNATYGGRGDTIYVLPGQYTESVTLKPHTSLLGHRGAYHGHVHSDTVDPAITASDGCVVRRLTVTEGSEGTALHALANASVTATNLVLHGSGTGLWAASGANVHLLNNTIFRNGEHGARVEAGATLATLKQNLFVENDVGLYCAEDGLESYSHNGYFDNEQNLHGAGHHDTDILADPGFVDPDSLNFHLRANSPMRDAGDPDASLNDPDGSRSDLGADGGPYGVQDTEAPLPVIATTPSTAVAASGVPVLFDGSASADEWGIQSYAWDFDASDGIQVDSTEAAAEWTYPAQGLYTVTLQATDHNGLTGTATALVTVVENGLELRAPDGGEMWPRGRTVEIAWHDRTGAYPSELRMELLRYGATLFEIGAASTAYAAYAWTIPASLESGGGYTVRIRTVESPLFEDASDAPFTIVAGDNDAAPYARWIGIDGPALEDSFQYPGNSGWFRFCAAAADAGREISIATSELGADADTHRSAGFLDDFGPFEHDPLRPVRKGDAVFDTVMGAATDRFADGALHPVSIRIVDAIEKRLVAHLEIISGPPEDPIDLVGPLQFIGLDVPLPVAHMGDALCFGQNRVALAQRAFGAFSLRDVLDADEHLVPAGRLE